MEAKEVEQPRIQTSTDTAEAKLKLRDMKPSVSQVTD